MTPLCDGSERLPRFARNDDLEHLHKNCALRSQ